MLCLSARTATSAWYDGDPAVKPDIPDFCWEEPDDPDILCGHVALANVLMYWDEQLCPDLVPDALETLTDGTQAYNLNGKFPLGLLQALKDPTYLGPGGTMCADMRRGITTWFANHGGGLRLEEECWWADEPKKPTWDFYETQLKACEIPIVGIEWDGGGHWMVGTGWDVDGSEKDMGFHDPNFSYPGGEEYYDWDLTGGHLADGFINFSYLGHDASVTCILSVSQIPEPATMSLLGVGLLAVLRRRRKQ